MRERKRSGERLVDSKCDIFLLMTINPKVIPSQIEIQRIKLSSVDSGYFSTIFH